MNARAAVAPDALSADKIDLTFRNLRQHLQARIIGQEHLVESLLIALLADGHLLVEGAPGLARRLLSRSWRPRCKAIFAAFSSLPICCPET